MITNTDSYVKKSIIKECDCVHLVVCYLSVKRYYAPVGTRDYDITMFAKCPITGGVYHYKDSNNIDGKILHYVNDEEMDYKLSGCTLSDLYAHYESWDDVSRTIAKHQGINNSCDLKDLIKSNFSNATFKTDKPNVTEVKQKRKILELLNPRHLF